MLPPAGADLEFTGGEGDRTARNRLETRWLARQLARWIETKADVRRAPGPVPQGALIVRGADGEPRLGMLGALSVSTAGLGVTPGNPLNLIQTSESPQEAALLTGWFEAQWAALRASAPAPQPGTAGSAVALPALPDDSPAPSDPREHLLEQLRFLASYREPAALYALILQHLFRASGEGLDEERIVRSATGIRDTVVWKKLYRFQRDGVVGALDKLERFGGCILADSVGLGKTFEALAVIKYHELRNDRVLVLCPKRLRDNWTLYKANDRRNVLASDRFHYDVLSHTDLSRDRGLSGDIDLSNIHWGNYDLVVSFRRDSRQPATPPLRLRRPKCPPRSVPADSPLRAFSPVRTPPGTAGRRQKHGNQRETAAGSLQLFARFGSSTWAHLLRLDSEKDGELGDPLVEVRAATDRGQRATSARRDEICPDDCRARLREPNYEVGPNSGTPRSRQILRAR